MKASPIRSAATFWRNTNRPKPPYSRCSTTTHRSCGVVLLGTALTLDYVGSIGTASIAPVRVVQVVLIADLLVDIQVFEGLDFQPLPHNRSYAVGIGTENAQLNHVGQDAAILAACRGWIRVTAGTAIVL